MMRRFLILLSATLAIMFSGVVAAQTGSAGSGGGGGAVGSCIDGDFPLISAVKCFYSQGRANAEKISAKAAAVGLDVIKYVIALMLAMAVYQTLIGDSLVDMAAKLGNAMIKGMIVWAVLASWVTPMFSGGVSVFNATWAIGNELVNIASVGGDVSGENFASSLAEKYAAAAKNYEEIMNRLISNTSDSLVGSGKK